MVKLIEEPVWTFSATADVHQHDIIWMKVTQEDGSHPSYLLFAESEGKRVRLEEISEFVKAASAYRIAQLQKQYAWNLTTGEWHGYHKDCIVELWKRSRKGEYLGQTTSHQLYLQTVTAILSLDFGTVVDMTDELVEEGRIGVTGSILISHAAYLCEKQAEEDETGHKDFGGTEWDWSCGYCGAKGEFAAGEPSPEDIACIENKYVEKNKG
jgi:hypothetical protein